MQRNSNNQVPPKENKMAYKHVGRLVTNQRKVVVAYRTVPGDAEYCVVVTTENLDSADHDSLMKLIESNAGQTADELAHAMARSTLSDGRNMLSGFHTTGKMIRVPTKDVEMTPDNKTVINLGELNQMIADQKGVTIDDLAVKDETTKKKDVTDEETAEVAVQEQVSVTENQVLSNDDLAAKYRSDADRLFKEAKRLREQAEELAPTKRKTKTTESA